jgi:hypothetical protein
MNAFAPPPVSRPGAVAVASGLSLAGAGAVLYATTWGIGTSVDSVAYIQAARVMASGSWGVSLVQHAPLYSLLLAFGGALGVDPMNGARWLNALAFGANIFLVGLLIRHVVTHLPWAWAVGSTLMLGLAPMLAIHVTALSEPVFLTATLAGFWWLARYIERPTLRRLFASAIALGMTLLARYAGAACILTGAIAIVYLGAGPLRRRVRDSMLFGVCACAPMALWIVRNVVVANTATGRELTFHPVGLPHAWQALYTASGWLLIPPSAPSVIRFAAWLVIGVLLVVAAVRAVGAPAAVPALVRVLTLFVVIYGAFLAASISFLDANTPLDDRILLPILAVSIVIVAYLLDTLWPLARRVPALGYATVALVLLLTGGHGVKAAELAATAYEKGWGFSSRTWRESPALRHVAQIDAHFPVFSNAPELVYLHTGRDARGIPRTRFLMNQQPNRQFATELAALRQQVREGCGVVVYLRNLAQKAMPGEAELGEQLSLDVLLDVEDGVIWGVSACPR